MRGSRRSRRRSRFRRRRSAHAASLQENPRHANSNHSGRLENWRSSVNRANALGVIASVLGPPTRTNCIGAANQFVYAFDSHGLLVYPEKEPGRDSIVIDFEPAADQCATKPFRHVEKLMIPRPRGQRFQSPRSLGKSGRNGGGASSGIFSLKYDRSA